MSDPNVREIERQIADRLADHDLSGPAFDPRLIAPDYRDRLQMDASLDALIGLVQTDISSDSDPGDPP